MFSFIVSMDKSVKNLGLSEPYFYSYMKENKFKIIFLEDNSLEKIFKNIKFTIQNIGIKKYQILFLIPSYEALEFYNGNLTNGIRRIDLNVLKLLEKENLKVEKINFLILDKLTRDFNEIPMRTEEYVAENLDEKGYIDLPSLSEKEMNEIKKLCGKFLENFPHNHAISKISYEDFCEKIDFIFENKINKIEDNKNAVEGSAIKENIKKYLEISRMLKNEIKKCVNINTEEQLDKFLIELLKINNYYYNYLFSNYDLEELVDIWGKGPKINNLGNGADKVIAKEAEELYQEVKKRFSEIIRKKIENIKVYKAITKKSSEGKGSFENSIYIDESKVLELESEFENRYFKNYLKEKINKMEINDLDSDKIKSPVEEIKSLLKLKYSLKSIKLEKYNIIKHKYNTEEKLRLNENMMGIAYLIQFLIEYSDQNLDKIRRGIVYNVKDIELKSIYNNVVLNKYKENLQEEIKKIEMSIDNMNSKILIKYYKIEDTPFHKNSILDNNREMPVFDKWIALNDINKFNDYNDELDWDINTYLKESEIELAEYESKKIKLISSLPEEIPGKIENEIERRKEIAQKLRSELNEAEEKVQICIKNNWKEEFLKLGLRKKLKDALEKRIKLQEVLIIAAISLMIPLVSYGYYTSFNWPSVFIKMIMAAFFTFLVGMHVVIKNKRDIDRIMENISTEYKRYSVQIKEKIELKRKMIEALAEYRAAEKNNMLLKVENKKINEEIIILTYSRNEIQKHLQMIDELIRVFNNAKSKNGFEKIEDYEDERKMPKIDETPNYKAPPFENYVFIPSQYCDIEKNREIEIIIENQKINFNPKNTFGCSSIELSEDKKLNFIN